MVCWYSFYSSCSSAWPPFSAPIPACLATRPVSATLPTAHGGQTADDAARLVAMEPIVLRGTLVRLEPLTLAHVPGLVAAAAEDRSTYGWTTVPDGVEAMTVYVVAALDEQAAGRVMAFATLAHERVVGSTRFMDMEYWQEPSVPSVVEIGS